MWLQGVPEEIGVYWACYEEPRTKRKEYGEISIDWDKKCFRRGREVNKVFGWYLIAPCPL
jgi:hypothetical protein